MNSIGPHIGKPFPAHFRYHASDIHRTSYRNLAGTSRSHRVSYRNLAGTSRSRLPTYILNLEDFLPQYVLLLTAIYLMQALTILLFSTLYLVHTSIYLRYNLRQTTSTKKSCIDQAYLPHAPDTHPFSPPLQNRIATNLPLHPLLHALSHYLPHIIDLRQHSQDSFNSTPLGFFLHSALK